VSSKLHFAIKVDCEPLAAKSPRCGGPESWEESERTVRGIREVYEKRGLQRALNFCLTPEAAKAHAAMWREWHAEGIHLGIQPNVPGFRYPDYDRDLGEYDEAMQCRIIAEATDDFAQVLGFRPTTYVACCGSKSPFTLRLLHEAGYRQTSSPAPGRYFPERPDRTTEGVFPFPHWANRNHHLMPGDLPLCVVPNAGDMTGGRGARPQDLRAEKPVSEETRALYRKIVDWNLELAALMEAPVRTIVVPTHNTQHVRLENVAYVADYVQEAAAQAGLELVPASFPEVRQALEAAMPPTTAGS